MRATEPNRNVHVPKFDRIRESFEGGAGAGELLRALITWPVRRWHRHQLHRAIRRDVYMQERWIADRMRSRSLE